MLAKIQPIVPRRIAAWTQAVGFWALLVAALLQEYFTRNGAMGPAPIEFLVQMFQCVFLIGAVTQLIALPWFAFVRDRSVPFTGIEIRICVLGCLYVVNVGVAVSICLASTRCSA